jgi:hypothetical protein
MSTQPPTGGCSIAVSFSDPGPTQASVGRVSQPRVGRGRASYPFARLSITPEQMAIRTPVGSAVVQRAAVDAVREVRKMFGAEIVFDIIDGSGSDLKIHSRKPDEILTALSRLGWPASPGMTS